MFHFTVLVAILSVTVCHGAAPSSFTVTFLTDIAGHGPIVLEVTRAWAPLGVDRFYDLVTAGYYTNNALFRNVPDFVLQFGMSGDPATYKKWFNAYIRDDPFAGHSNAVGNVVFATSGPNSRTTQLFINLGNNAFLDRDGFVPIGRVASGMDTVRAAVNPTPGDDGGVNQYAYGTRGNVWIKASYPKINFITNATTS